MKMSGCWHWLVLPSVLFGLPVIPAWCCMTILWLIVFHAIFFGVLLLLLASLPLIFI